VAILGIGGLGHLGMQFAAKMGFNTVAIARGPELGAHRYSKAEDAAKVLTELGGAKVILATVTNAKAMSVLIGGLGIDGKLLVVGVSPEALSPMPHVPCPSCGTHSPEGRQVLGEQVIDRPTSSGGHRA
jgi:D-arabinose 1-dehydrogenase-like Zn-dependent alcohol dehydrogenase